MSHQPRVQQCLQALGQRPDLLGMVVEAAPEPKANHPTVRSNAAVVEEAEAALQRRITVIKAKHLVVRLDVVAVRLREKERALNRPKARSSSVEGEQVSRQRPHNNSPPRFSQTLAHEDTEAQWSTQE